MVLGSEKRKCVSEFLAVIHIYITTCGWCAQWGQGWSAMLCVGVECYIEVLYWDFFFCFYLLVGYADAKAPTGCDCETAYQQCRKQNGCNNYYRFLTERMIKRIWAGGFNPGAGSSNPCATCVSISIMTFKSLIF